jgi:hypothetical protein
MRMPRILPERIAAQWGGALRTTPLETALEGVAKHTTGSGTMNKLETAYSQHLDLKKFGDEIADWKFNALRFHLGGGSWFKPDFCVFLRGGGLEVHEVKGHWREAARVRIRVAASLFPFWTFTAVTRDKRTGAWKYEEIRP